MRLLNAEIRKLRTVTTTWVLTGVAVGLVALFAALTVFLDPITMAAADFTGSDLEIAAVLDMISVAEVFVLVVAVLLITTEFRHGTIGRTLQITPSRTRMLVSKFVAGGLYAVAFCVVVLVVVAGLVLLATAGSDAAIEIGPQVRSSLWQTPLAFAMAAVFGVAFGALVRSQVVAVTVILVWNMAIEQLIAWQLPQVGRFLPFRAVSAVFTSPETAANLPEGMQPLAPGPGLAVFLAYVVVFAIAAIARLRYRDV